jgi:hypothetical protein
MQVKISSEMSVTIKHTETRHNVDETNLLKFRCEKVYFNYLEKSQIFFCCCCVLNP